MSEYNNEHADQKHANDAEQANLQKSMPITQIRLMMYCTLIRNTMLIIPSLLMTQRALIRNCTGLTVRKSGRAFCEIRA